MKKILLSAMITIATSLTLLAQPAGWTYIKGYTIHENSGTLVTDYQLQMTINTQDLVTFGEMKSDGSDIRFSKDCAGNVMYSYWIDASTMNTANTIIWVKIDTLLASTDKSIYLFHGNPSASAVSSLSPTFIGPHSATDSVASGGAGGSTNSQRGFRFAPTEDLLVGAFGKMEPTGTTRYITLFNFSTQAILSQMQASGPAGQYSYAMLANPMWLTQGTQYVLELYQGSSDGYYFGTSSQIGQHLTYFDMRYCNSCTQNTFPTSTLSNYHYGYPDLWYFTKKNVSPAPTYNISGSAIFELTGDETFCEGESNVLHATYGLGNTYQWLKDGLPIGAGLDSLDVTTYGSGNYQVTMTTQIGCVFSDAILVNEIPYSAAPTMMITAPVNSTQATLCANTAFTLNSSTPNVSEYLWYKNGVAVNYTLSPTYTLNTGTTAGTDYYTLRVVYINDQCLSALSLPDTIIKSIPNTIITPNGPTTFCASNPTTLNATGGYNNYTWKRSNTVVQSGASSAHMPTASGNHNVTITDGNGCSKTSAWTNIIVNPLPIANAGLDKSICRTTSVQIGSTNNPANTYAWTPMYYLSNPFVSNPTTSILVDTTYTVTVTNPATGCTNTDMMHVNIMYPPAVPTINGSALAVCEGNTISITPTSVGASSINWYKNNVLLYNKPTNFVQVVSVPSAQADLYDIRAKGANGCLSSYGNGVSAWVKAAALPTITSNPQAVGSVVTVCVPGGTSGSAILLANSTTPSPSYSWKLAGAFIPNANQSSYLTTVTTNQSIKAHTVQATYPNGCVRTSANLTVKLVTSNCTPRLGSDKEDADILINDALSIALYPNPTTGVLNIDIANSLENEGKIIVYNTLGQAVIEKSVNLIQGSLNEELDVSHLSAGVYSLSFQTANSHKVQKLVKE